MTMLDDAAPLISAMEALGRDLLAWRDDPRARHVHDRAALKSEGDRRAHARLVQALARHAGGVPVISEEDASHAATRPGLYWLIDPIDGTASWLDGFDGFVTQVALIDAGVPVLGLVHAPAQGTTWSAARGEGAWRNGLPMKRLLPRKGCIIVDNTPEPHGTAAFLMERLPITGYRESGSLGLKSCLVADGTADLFAKSVVVRDWDLAPAAAILGEVGGTLVGADGAAFPFRDEWEKPRGFVVARDAAMARSACEAMADERTIADERTMADERGMGGRVA